MIAVTLAPRSPSALHPRAATDSVESVSTSGDRRAGVEALAAAVRALADAAAETAIGPADLAIVTDSICDLTARLRAEVDDRPYSGLVRRPVDYTIPEDPMPLNPIIGACSPTRPDVHLRLVDGEVRGTATFTRRFVGPPGFAHGGIAAMLADQIVAIAPMAVGARCITKQIHVRFRRPLPLDEPVGLWGVCEPDGGGFIARYTISARGEVAVEGTGELVTFERFAQRSP